MRNAVAVRTGASTCSELQIGPSSQFGPRLSLAHMTGFPDGSALATVTIRSNCVVKVPIQLFCLPLILCLILTESGNAATDAELKLRWTRRQVAKPSSSRLMADVDAQREIAHKELPSLLSPSAHGPYKKPRLRGE